MHRLIGIARLKVIGQQLEERRASRVQEVPRSGERGGAIPDVREACGREIGVVQERVRRNEPPVDRDQIALSIEEKTGGYREGRAEFKEGVGEALHLGEQLGGRGAGGERPAQCVLEIRGLRVGGEVLQLGLTIRAPAGEQDHEQRLLARFNFLGLAARAILERGGGNAPGEQDLCDATGSGCVQRLRGEVLCRAGTAPRGGLPSPLRSRQATRLGLSDSEFDPWACSPWGASSLPSRRAGKSGIGGTG